MGRLPFLSRGLLLFSLLFISPSQADAVGLGEPAIEAVHFMGGRLFLVHSQTGVEAGRVSYRSDKATTHVYLSEWRNGEAVTTLKVGSFDFPVTVSLSGVKSTLVLGLAKTESADKVSISVFDPWGLVPCGSTSMTLARGTRVHRVRIANAGRDFFAAVQTDNGPIVGHATGRGGVNPKGLALLKPDRPKASGVDQVLGTQDFETLMDSFFIGVEPWPVTVNEQVADLRVRGNGDGTIGIEVVSFLPASPRSSVVYRTLTYDTDTRTTFPTGSPQMWTVPSTDYIIEPHFVQSDTVVLGGQEGRKLTFCHYGKRAGSSFDLCMGKVARTLPESWIEDLDDRAPLSWREERLRNRGRGFYSVIPLLVRAGWTKGDRLLFRNLYERGLGIAGYPPKAKANDRMHEIIAPRMETALQGCANRVARFSNNQPPPIEL